MILYVRFNIYISGFAYKACDDNVKIKVGIGPESWLLFKFLF